MPPVCLGLVLGGLASCAQLAGIDDTSGLIPPDRVSLQMEGMYIGASVTREPLDLTGLGAKFYVADDNEADGILRVDGELLTPDTWSAEVKDGTPPVFFDLPDYPVPIRRQFEFPLRNLIGLYPQLSHPSPQPAPAAATLSVRATLPAAYAATESFQLYTLGSWNVRGFTGVEIPAVGATVFGPVMFPFTSMASITGRPHEKITTADAVMFLRYIGNRLTGVMEAAPFDQTGTDAIMGTMTAVGADQALSIMVGPPATVAARFAPARPGVPTLAMSWALHAAPGYEVANDNGPLLHAAGVAMADTGMINVMYGNPFVAKGWRSTLTWSTSATRSYMPTGSTLPATLAAGLFQVVEPSPNLVLDLPAGLPEVITIDGKPLSTDGLTISTPTKGVSVTFVAGITTNTLYQIQLYELVPNTANTALVQKYVLSSTGIKAEFTIPPEFLVPGKIYNLRAICIQGGYPGVADGDLRKRELPYAVGYLDGGVFTVTP